MGQGWEGNLEVWNQKKKKWVSPKNDYQKVLKTYFSPGCRLQIVTPIDASVRYPSQPQKILVRNRVIHPTDCLGLDIKCPLGLIGALVTDPFTYLNAEESASARQWMRLAVAQPSQAIMLANHNTTLPPALPKEGQMNQSRGPIVLDLCSPEDDGIIYVKTLDRSSQSSPQPADIKPVSYFFNRNRLPANKAVYAHTHTLQTLSSLLVRPSVHLQHRLHGSLTCCLLRCVPSDLINASTFCQITHFCFNPRIYL